MLKASSDHPALLLQLNGFSRILSALSSHELQDFLHPPQSDIRLSRSIERRKRLYNAYRSRERCRKANIENLNRLREMMAAFHSQLILSLSK